MGDLSRRGLLAAGLAGAGAALLAGCSETGTRQAPATTSAAQAPTTSSRSGAPRGTAAPAPAPALAKGGPAQAVFAGPRDGRSAALTFHGSGDPVLVTRLLDLLDRYHTPVSLFAVGSWLDRNRDLGRRFLAGGHELDNHTATHPVLGWVPRAVVAAEIEGCRRSLVRLTGTGGRYFRPSGMTVPTPLVLAEAGRAGYPVVVSFDVDSHDFADPGADAVVARVAARLRPGSIVSLHTGHAGTVAALPRILGAIADRGLRPVALHRLLEGAERR